ncbi:MAG TPA: universal stress protein [Geobacteraceae bacterium]|nr:universal stress protein [Geobacteraceae bacterium]
MKVVCAIGQRGGAELIQRLAKILGSRIECLMLHVIDTGPRHDLEGYLAGPLHRRPHHEEQLRAAEESAGRAAVEEALAAAQKTGQKAEGAIREGTPEKIIVEVAAEVQADLIAIWTNEGETGHPRIGPASVGHTARFVVERAPCDVLLLRDDRLRT